MSKKTVEIKMPPGKAAISAADAWVQQPAEDAGPGQEEAPAEPMKRFTIDVGEGLHKRIKTQCAMRGVKMADAIRLILEREFPAA